MKYILLMIGLGVTLIALQITMILHFKPEEARQQSPTVIDAIVNISTSPTSTEAISKPKQPTQQAATTTQTAPTAPQQVTPPTIIIVPTQQPMQQPQPATAPSSSPSTSPSPSPATSTPATSTPPVSQPPPTTEEQATPVIEIDGNRVGVVVTFTWKATGFKEPLQCKANGEPVEQEGTLTVESVQPYTLTIVCVGKNTASHSEKSLTK